MNRPADLRVRVTTTACAAAAGALLALLAACAGVVVGGGAATGVAAYQERGIDGVGRDLKIEAEVIDLWFRHDHTFLTRFGIEVWEARVLITGVTDDATVAAEVAQLAWQADGVKDVINEIQIAKAGDAIDLARDSWITTQIRSKITFDKEILAINYAVETVNGVVHLIGIAQNPAELDRVVAHVRAIAYVRNVVSHVRVKGTAA